MLKIKSGIYKITCLINGKIYVGSAVDLYSRKAEHFRDLRKGRHHNKKLQRSYDKYGIKNFIFEIIESVVDKIKLIEREQFYIDTLKPHFNLAKIAGSLLGFKHSKKTVRKAGKTRKQTLLNHPEIMEEAKEKRKQTYIENPELTPNAIEKFKQTLANNPEIKQEATRKRKETLEKNPDITIDWIEKRKQTYIDHPEKRQSVVDSLKRTFAENPEIKINATKKLKETLANDPSIVEKWLVKFKETMLNRPILACPHCDYQSKNKSNMTKYHFDNCKNKQK